MTSVHEGRAAGRSARAASWSTSITTTTEERVFVRGIALDDAIGTVPFPAMLLRLWRGDVASDEEAEPQRLPGRDDRPWSPRAIGPGGAHHRVHPGRLDERAGRRHPLVR